MSFFVTFPSTPKYPKDDLDVTKFLVGHKIILSLLLSNSTVVPPHPVIPLFSKQCEGNSLIT